MANFINIKYISAGNNEDNFTVNMDDIEKPYSININIDNVEAVSNVIRNKRLIVKLSSGETTTMSYQYIIIYMVSKKYYVLPESEYNKFITEKIGL